MAMEKVINCENCGAILLKLQELKEFKVKLRCGKCKKDQIVSCKQVYETRIEQVK